ncbi:MAG: KpsF/GutQ family sugar-phosphate isomerase [Alphaproteobacteria bacterium]
MNKSGPAAGIGSNELIASAEETITIEVQGLAKLGAALGQEMRADFLQAVETIGQARGRIIVCGMGKSGLVGRKIASTLASTGTPASFVHPGEASHGDLGMITRDDVIIALSWSGEAQELMSVLDYSRRFRVALIAITSKRDSALGRAADIILALPEVREACPHGLAPTTSTTMQLALGDALAMALLRWRGFTAADFKTFHPGGRLGARLVLVRDLMHVGNAMPLAPSATPMAQALVIMTEKSLGVLGVTDAGGALAGIITDGDLRRKMSSSLLEETAGQIMTASPKCITPDTLSATALEVINATSITSLFVVEDDRPVGIIHIHDLLRAGVA